MSAMAGTIIRAVGFNPFRQQRRRRSDYVFLATALLVTAALLAWASGLTK